ncbi:ethylene-responsive transcription factor ERF024-like [Primulina huaijiensis]|uniref:ethylene-responsive transcription factor ERF024-like n=1 Tax=Primulina huaijiensis TaxID=1492673 RepID=UPI003CC738C6
MDFDQSNQWWNPSSSSFDHDAQLVAEANPDEKSSIAFAQRKRGGRKINRRLSEVRDPNKKSTRSSLGNPELVVAAAYDDVAAVKVSGKIPQLDFSASLVCPPWAESNANDDIQNAARYFSSCSSSSSGIMSELPAEKTPVEMVSNAPAMDLWGKNVCYDHDGNIGFMDEEAVFNMPGLVNSMAEGMLLTPPAMKSGFKWDDIDDRDDYVYFNLWENS